MSDAHEPMDPIEPNDPTDPTDPTTRPGPKRRPRGRNGRTDVSAPTVVQSVTVSAEEWERVFRLATVSRLDERDRLGCIRLHTVAGVRCWDATDSYCAVRLLGEADPASYDVLIPHTIVRYAFTASDAPSETTLVVTVDADLVQRVGIRTASGSHTVLLPESDFPDFDTSIFDRQPVVADATLAARSLLSLAKTSRTSRYPLDEDDDEEEPDYWLSIGEQGVSVFIDWPGLGETEYHLAADGSGASVTRLINPAFLDALVSLMPASEEVTISVPGDSNHPLYIKAHGVVAALMPKSPERAQRERVETVIELATGSLGTTADEHGNYPLQRRVVPVYGRIDESDADVFTVFAVLLDEVASGPDLLTELNDLNRNIGFARLVHDGERVLAQVDLVAPSMDPDELSTAIERIVDIAERVVPMLAVVHGGQAPVDPEVARWDVYRSMELDAEVRPSVDTPLIGPRAVRTWPFPGAVYVLSGWNPQGIERADDANESVNVLIAQDILRAGGRFVHGRVHLSDGEYAEPSLIAWGISRDDALNFGRKASRDAIVRIDDDEVRLLSCSDDRTMVWPRLERTR